MDEAQRLIAAANAYAREGDRLTAAFVRELRRVLRASERELAALVAEGSGTVTLAARAQRALTVRRQVRQILTAQGFDAVAGIATEAAAEGIVRQVLSARDIAELASLRGGSGVQTIEALRQLWTLDLLEQGDAAATAIWRAVVQEIYGGQGRADVIRGLGRVLDRSERQAATLYDTQVSIFTRQVEAVAMGDEPDQAYLYVGPADGVTRPFCLEHVGTVLTRQEIDGLDNGQLPNPFFTGGGYNCRHTWMAVVSPELKAMAGSDRRIEGVSSAVRRAKSED